MVTSGNRVPRVRKEFSDVWQRTESSSWLPIPLMNASHILASAKTAFPRIQYKEHRIHLAVLQTT